MEKLSPEKMPDGDEVARRTVMRSRPNGDEVAPLYINLYLNLN